MHHVNRPAVAAAAVTMAGLATVLLLSSGGEVPEVPSVRPSGGPEAPPAAVPAISRARHQRNCFRRPSRCGYPDATNSGVPAGYRLRAVAGARLPSGTSWNGATHELTVKSDGTTLEGLLVAGTIVVRASHVTIRNTRVIAPAGAFGIAVPGDAGAGATTLDHVTVRGVPGALGSTAAVNNRGDNDLTIIASRLRDCTMCLQNEARGPGTTVVRDSYMRTSRPQLDCGNACPHYEAVYVSGNPGPMTLTHNTLLNPINQTAVVFVNENRQDGLTIRDNLIAGGGYSIYGGTQSRRQVIKDNRLSTAYSRVGKDTYTARSWPIPEVCTARRSAGCFGNLTQAPADGNLLWRANYWDDTLKPADP